MVHDVVDVLLNKLLPRGLQCPKALHSLRGLSLR